MIHQSHPELTCGDLDLNPLGITPDGIGDPEEGLFSPAVAAEALPFLFFASNSCFCVIFHSWLVDEFFAFVEEDTALWIVAKSLFAEEISASSNNGCSGSFMSTLNVLWSSLLLSKLVLCWSNVFFLLNSGQFNQF